MNHPFYLPRVLHHTVSAVESEPDTNSTKFNKWINKEINEKIKTLIINKKKEK